MYFPRKPAGPVRTMVRALAATSTRNVSERAAYATGPSVVVPATSSVMYFTSRSNLSSFDSVAYETGPSVGHDHEHVQNLTMRRWPAFTP